MRTLSESAFILLLCTLNTENIWYLDTKMWMVESCLSQKTLQINWKKRISKSNFEKNSFERFSGTTWNAHSCLMRFSGTTWCVFMSVVVLDLSIHYSLNEYTDMQTHKRFDLNRSRTYIYVSLKMCRTKYR